MAAESIGGKRKRQEEDAACGMCQIIPEYPMKLACGHVVCSEHGMPGMCPTCKAPLRKAFSRFFHENWALQHLVKYFGGHDGNSWTGQRSVYIDENAVVQETALVRGVPKLVWVYRGPFDASDRRREPGVHRHTFDFAAGLGPDTVGIVVEVQGMQHVTSEARKRKDRIKRVWAGAFPDRVYFYRIETWTKEQRGDEIHYNKCSITDFEQRVRDVVLNARERARVNGVTLPAPEKA